MNWTKKNKKREQELGQVWHPLPLSQRNQGLTPEELYLSEPNFAAITIVLELMENDTDFRLSVLARVKNTSEEKLLLTVTFSQAFPSRA
ncbi:hypothetical protein [Labrys monachus]|uniref:hypothetical protein n=1 Tax=Labrys monachus TaxID=217067 RepID=UPI0027D79381|nr:hypothetical protein [Labrys monachus]